MSNEVQNPASCQTAVSGSAFSIHDLKCGNILNYDTAEGEILPTVIDWQDLKWLTEDPKGFNLVHSPIPLTEEWLLKFGFISNPYQDRYELVNIYFQGCKLCFECDKTKGFTELWISEFPNIKYVHQLQNLFHIVTGSELQLV